MFDHFHFLQPYWLLLLPVLVALVVLTKRHSLNRSHWSKVCDPELLPFLEQQGSAKKSVGLPIIALIAIALLVIAAAQPVWKQMPQPVFQKNDAVVIALDLSASMNATDLKPSRLQRARFKIKDLLARIPDAQVALIVYAADAFTVTPLTEDNDTILDQLPVMSPEIMPVQGSRADRALQKADQLLTQAGIAKGNIVLVSDEVLPAQIAATASRLKINGRQVSILAVGTEQGAPIPRNDALLTDRQGNVVVAKTRLSEMQESAGLGGGSAVMITLDDRDVAYLAGGFQENDQLLAESTQQLNRWIAEGPWFVLLALPLLLPLFRKGILNLILPVCLGMGLVYPTDLYANPEAEAESTETLKQTWRNLWKTKDQQGYELYQQGDADKAAVFFENPRWKQLSYYRFGEYEESLAALKVPVTSEDWYNRGNILARLGRLDEAIRAYNEALKKNPDFENAIHNRDVVEEFKKQPKYEQEQFGKRGSQPDLQDEGAVGDSSDDQGNKKDGAAGGDKQNGNSPDQNSAGQGSDSKSTQDAEETQEAGKEKNVPKPQSRPLIDEHGAARAQMLNSIDDDPSGLWRRKFIYQYRQQAGGQAAEDKQW